MMIFLKSEGYIEPATELHRYIPSYDGEETYWRTTIKGNALSMASAARWVSRKTAERKLQDFLARVDEVKNDDRWIYKVQRVILFGSYLDPNKETLGDVDLAIELTCKYDQSEWRDRVEEYLQKERASGRIFGTFLEEISSPQLDIRKYLRSRSRVLKIHPIEDEIWQSNRHEVIYENIE